MIKTYEAPNTIISDINLIWNNKLFRVSFLPVSQFVGTGTGHGSMLKTADPELQAAIEHSGYFHTEIFIYKSEEEKVEEKKEPVEVSFERIKVSSPADARDILHERFGIEKNRIVSPKAIMNAAAKVGVIFDGVETGK